MSLFIMHFSGDVRKPQIKEIGGKKAIEFQLMKKNYSPAGQEATFSWVRITVFDAKDWQVDQCQEGKFVSGYGEFTLRSFVDKDGAKRQSAEIRSSSFQVDAARSEQADAAPAKVSHRNVPAKAAAAEEDIPFAGYLGADAWG